MFQNDPDQDYGHASLVEYHNTYLVYNTHKMGLNDPMITFNKIERIP